MIVVVVNNNYKSAADASRHSAWKIGLTENTITQRHITTPSPASISETSNNTTGTLAIDAVLQNHIHTRFIARNMNNDIMQHTCNGRLPVRPKPSAHL